MKFLTLFCNLITVISISLFVSFFLPAASSLSLQTKKLDFYKSQFAPKSPKLVTEENEWQRKHETLVLHKGDELDTALWHTPNGDVVKLVHVALSYFEEVQKAQSHEPSFLRDDASNTHCKHEDSSSFNSQVESATAAALQGYDLQDKIKFNNRKNVDRFARKSVYEPRTFFGSLFSPYGPPGPGPFFGPPGPGPFYGPPGPFGPGPMPPYMGPDPYWY